MQLNDPDLLRHQAYIDGKWCDAPDGSATEIFNPANDQSLGFVPNLGADETRRAIEAAQAAQPAWRALTAKERAARLRKWYELMLANQEDLARIMTAEQGKPLTEARGEVLYAASFIEWFAEEAKRVYGDTIPGHQPDKRLIVTKEPIGVTAAITPWNFPAAMITRKAGPALAAGCAMVLKPAPQTPFSALRWRCWPSARAFRPGCSAYCRPMPSVPAKSAPSCWRMSAPMPSVPCASSRHWAVCITWLQPARPVGMPMRALCLNRPQPPAWHSRCPLPRSAPSPPAPTRRQPNARLIHG